MTPSKNNDRRPAGVLGFLRDMVRLQSTPGEEAQVVGRVVAEMHRLGYEDAHGDDAGKPGGRVGQGSPVLLIDSQIDTTPMHSPGKWTHDPLSADIDDD